MARPLPLCDGLLLIRPRLDEELGWKIEPVVGARVVFVSRLLAHQLADDPPVLPRGRAPTHHARVPAESLRHASIGPRAVEQQRARVEPEDERGGGVHLKQSLT